MAADRGTGAPTLGRRSLLAGSLGLLGLGGLAGLTACAHPSGGGAVAAVPGIALLPAATSRAPVPLAQAPDLAAVVDGMTRFGEHLHQVTATADANYTASPLSMAIAFGMLRAGARKRTASQIDTVFGYPNGPAPQGSPHRALNALMGDLVTDGPVSRDAAPTPSGQPGPLPIVAVVNGLFIDKGFKSWVAPEYLAVLAEDYAARVGIVDFTTPQAKRAIDVWVVAQTRGRITKLFDALDPQTVLVLANAVYLKAAWLNQFEQHATTRADFTTTAGTHVAANLMHQSLKAATYGETADWQRVTLPYVGGELTMRVVLPRATVRSVSDLTKLLPAATARTTTGQVSLVDLSLPRWDGGTDIDLKAPLVALGMSDAFDLADVPADLSGIAREHLYVGQAVHRANITVDEKGTEAAAVTGIAVDTVSAVVGTPVVMKVDRPFVWAVVHEPTGAPVFVGHVVDPSK